MEKADLSMNKLKLGPSLSVNRTRVPCLSVSKLGAMEETKVGVGSMLLSGLTLHCKCFLSLPANRFRKPTLGVSVSLMKSNPPLEVLSIR